MREDDERGVGAWRAFERCYARVGREADFVAPCDQDDVWHPAKLATLPPRWPRARRWPSATCGSSTAPGSVLSPTYWTDRVATWDDLGAELQTNVVTGAACLVRREVLDVALPFPAELDGSFHDHWLAVCALALGELAYVTRRWSTTSSTTPTSTGWSRRRAARRAPAAGRRPRARATASATSSARGCGRARCSSACRQ